MTTTQAQIRRDTETNIAAATPAAGEPFYDTTNKRLGVGDGLTAGGIPHVSAFDEQNQKFVYPSVGGTGDAIVLTNTPPKDSLIAGQRGMFKAGANNTLAATINEDGLGAKNVKKMHSGSLAALVANDLVAGGMYEYVYDGTQYQIKGLAEGPFTSGGLVYLGSATASTSATIDLTSLMSSTYDDYVITLDSIIPVSDANSLLLQCSPDNSTFDSGPNYIYANAEVAAPFTSGGTTAVNLTNSHLSNANFGGVSGTITLFGANSSALAKKATGLIVFRSSVTGGASGAAIAAQWVNTTNSLEAVRFLMASGNIASGTFRVYVISKS